MYNRSEIPSFDPHGPDIDAHAGIPTDNDPWSIDREARSIDRREKQAQELHAQRGLDVARQALETLRPGTSTPIDNDAPKRNRARLRAPE